MIRSARAALRRTAACAAGRADVARAPTTTPSTWRGSTTTGRTDGHALRRRQGRPGAAAPNFSKSIDYSKKVLATLPQVEVGGRRLPAVGARAARQGRSAPDRQHAARTSRRASRTARCSDEAMFYLGVALPAGAQVRERRCSALDEFLDERAQARAGALRATSSAPARSCRSSAPAEAADGGEARCSSASPRAPLCDRALAARAEALLAAERLRAGARTDFRDARHARRATTRSASTILLREADCLEAARELRRGAGAAARRDRARARAAAARHHRRPAGDGARPRPARDRYGPAADPDRHGAPARGPAVGRGARRPTGASIAGSIRARRSRAEAQYRIGYAYETVADDFDEARDEYAKVREQCAGSAFVDPGAAAAREPRPPRAVPQRAGGDSLQKRGRGRVPARRAVPVPARQARARARGVPEDRATSIAGTPCAAQGDERAGLGAEPQARPQRRGRLAVLGGGARIPGDRGAARGARLPRGGRARRCPTELIKLPEPPPPPPVDTLPRSRRRPPGSTPLGSLPTGSDSLSTRRRSRARLARAGAPGGVDAASGLARSRTADPRRRAPGGDAAGRGGAAPIAPSTRVPAAARLRAAHATRPCAPAPTPARQRRRRTRAPTPDAPPTRLDGTAMSAALARPGGRRRRAWRGTRTTAPDIAGSSSTLPRGFRRRRAAGQFVQLLLPPRHRRCCCRGR